MRLTAAGVCYNIYQIKQEFIFEFSASLIIALEGRNEIVLKVWVADSFISKPHSEV